MVHYYHEKFVNFIMELFDEFHAFMMKDDYRSALITLRTLICYVPSDYHDLLLSMYDEVKGGIYEDRLKSLEDRARDKTKFANDLYVLFQNIAQAFYAGGLFRKPPTPFREVGAP